ncbi:MAG: anthranilate synthase component I family protein [Bacteroidia bacterium]|nr:anthranilate synthase component I family protein [Sphingobacteriaceae bacterium]MBK7816754.1 anthranilate synthase component I family protein [Sphingobacteriaceae bacterium]MBP9070027.1 anthranilate synthase component I family protein [Bacteroidia bacterium]
MNSNSLITLNNDHPEGSESSFYELGERQNKFANNSVVLINYDQTQNFYPVKAKRPFSASEIKGEKSNGPLKLHTLTNKEEYIKRVNDLKHHIHIGDIYEINFCVEFEAKDVDIDPVSVFLKLNQLAKAPYAALAKLDDTYIISASPELFLKRKGDVLITKPIKGTAKRSTDPHEDENLKQQLHLSLKERTENVMIVDVSRNDLSILAQRATVTVPKLYTIETYETVHQMVSTVQCKLKPEQTFETIIAATFPMPSMTGAPKIRAMQLIEEFEQFKRKEYSGAMGYVDEKGDFILSVLIRTLVYNTKTKRLSFAVGSAITHLCDAEKEYEECLLKAKALLKAINGVIPNVQII